MGLLARLGAINEAVSAFVWGVPMLLLFFCVGVFFTVKTRGIQFSRLKEIIFSPFCAQGGKTGSISAFSALSGALAGTLGIGNIVGVAGAILLGGPGSVFWMLASAFFCMILKYAETVLALLYRTKNERGETVGGPMYYMRDGLKFRLMPAVFSVLCLLTALFGAGNVTQIGTIAKGIEETFSINGLWVSGACAVMIWLMTGGSVKRLGRVFSFLTPGMSAGFMAAALLVIFKNGQQLPQAIGGILAGAFHPGAAASGVGAYTLLAAMKYGVARGVFSNEAGLGSSPIIHAASSNTPVKQGMCGAFEVFFDTVIMAGLTALAILVSGAPLTAQTPISLCTAAFASVFGRHSGALLTLMLAVFAISSVPCWYFYGEKCVEYLTAKAGGKTAYRLLFFALMAVCPVLKLDGMWQLADTLNGLMAVPNLIAIVMLSKEVVLATDRYYASLALNKRR